MCVPLECKLYQIIAFVKVGRTHFTHLWNKNHYRVLKILTLLILGNYVYEDIAVVLQERSYIKLLDI